MTHDLLFWATGISLLTGFVLAVMGTALVRRSALRRGFIDLPGGHKSHTTPIALGGGIAITWAILLPQLAIILLVNILTHAPQWPEWIPESFSRHVQGLWDKSDEALGIIAGALLLHIMGLVDDRKALGPYIKLFVQLIIAIALVIGLDIRMLSAFGTIPSMVFSILWIVGITNSFNFLDNMDGLCAGVAAICGTIFAFTAVRSDQLFVPALSLLVVGAALGFLWHNFPPAKIFMGDSGSLVLGYMLAVLTIMTTFWKSDTGASWVNVLIPIIVLAVPLYDTTSVVWIRLRKGINPLRGDRRHFSHRLVQRGLTPRNAVLTIYMATVATGISAALLPKATTTVALLVLAQCLCIVLIIALLEQVGRNQ
ncbi:MAG: putative undecaprenyl-phosphate N-acetylglucosaminyl 1-phosphate transferase [Phycisphaerae bacterium]|nr:putative undecaprenyl-phosphate N-acetylglucosaminyl 1-phosphate transferase [Phycisphaerae bacterium]